MTFTAVLIGLQYFNLSLGREIVSLFTFGLSPVGIIQVSELLTLIFLQALLIKLVLSFCKLSVVLFTHILVKIAMIESINLVNEYPPQLKQIEEGQTDENKIFQYSLRKRTLSLKLETLLGPVFNKRTASFDSESLHSDSNEISEEMCDFDFKLIKSDERTEEDLADIDMEDIFPNIGKEQSRKRSGCFPILPSFNFDKTKTQVRSFGKTLSKRKFSFGNRKKSRVV